MKIAVIEDHTLVREVLVVACRMLYPDGEVGEASTGQRGVELCRKLRPDVAFLDLLLPDGDGLDFLKDILSGSPETRVIALTSHADEFTLHRALRSRIHGFVDKNEQPLKVLGEAIESVMAGRRYLSSVARRVSALMRVDPLSFNKVLSDREQDLTRWFGEGYSNEEVAKLAGIAIGTVKVHRCKIMKKLGMHSTPELMRYARDKGFVRH